MESRPLRPATKTMPRLTKAMLRKAGVEIISITEPPSRRPIRAASSKPSWTSWLRFSPTALPKTSKGEQDTLPSKAFYLGAEAPIRLPSSKRYKVGEKYHQKLVIDPETGKIARSVFDHCLAGKSINYIIQRLLRQRGSPVPKD